MNEKQRRNQSRLNFLFGTLDVIISAITFVAAAWITKELSLGKIKLDGEFVLMCSFVVIIWMLLLKSTHLARIPRTSSVTIIFTDFLKLTLIGGVILITLDWLIKLDNYPAIALAIFIVLNLFSLFILRVLTFKVFKIYRANGHNTKNVIILAGENADKTIDKIYNQKEWGFRIMNLVTGSERIRTKYNKKLKVYPTSINLKSLIKFDIVDEVICCDCNMSNEKLDELMEYCQSIGVSVRIQGITKLNTPFKTKLYYFDKTPFLTMVPTPRHRYSFFIKTISDIALSFVILFLLSPALIIISLVIALTSKGPVIFKQERVGLRGRKFYIYKFRTMVQNAEELKAKLEAQNESDGPTFKIKKDPRITSIGAFLRKTSLDEIPQLFNVIKGEMSLIGPRPPLPSEVAQYEEWYLKRLAVKPGLTCTWQIVPERNDVKFDDWMEMDINYIENWSLRSDISLFFKTFKTVLFARGY